MILRMGFPPSFVEGRLKAAQESAAKPEKNPAPGDTSTISSNRSDTTCVRGQAESEVTSSRCQGGVSVDAEAVAEEARAIARDLGLLEDGDESLLDGDSSDSKDAVYDFVVCKKDDTMHNHEEGDKNGVTHRDRVEWAEAKLAAWPILRDFNAVAKYQWDDDKGVQWQHSQLKVDRDPKHWYIHSETAQTPTKTSRLNPDRWSQWVNQIPEAKVIGHEALVVIYHGAGTVVAYDVPFCDIPNHSSCVVFADRISAELDWYDASGVHEWLPEGMDIADFIDRINPFLVVVRSPDDGMLSSSA